MAPRTAYLILFNAQILAAIAVPIYWHHRFPDDGWGWFNQGLIGSAMFLLSASMCWIFATSAPKEKGRA